MKLGCIVVSLGAVAVILMIATWLDRMKEPLLLILPIALLFLFLSLFVGWLYHVFSYVVPDGCAVVVHGFNGKPQAFGPGQRIWYIPGLDKLSLPYRLLEHSFCYTPSNLRSSDGICFECKICVTYMIDPRLAHMKHLQSVLRISEEDTQRKIEALMGDCLEAEISAKSAHNLRSPVNRAHLRQRLYDILIGRMRSRGIRIDSSMGIIIEALHSCSDDPPGQVIKYNRR